MSDVVTGAPARYGKKRPKVAAFARYEGTSAWRKDRRRVRAFALFQAAAKRDAAQAETAAR